MNRIVLYTGNVFGNHGDYLGSVVALNLQCFNLLYFYYFLNEFHCHLDSLKKVEYEGELSEEDLGTYLRKEYNINVERINYADNNTYETVCEYIETLRPGCTSEFKSDKDFNIISFQELENIHKTSKINTITPLVCQSY